MIVSKLHQREGKTVLAAADRDLVGRIFEENGIILEISKEFYQDKIIDKEELAELIKSADVVNLIGKECVSVAKDQGVVGAVFLEVKGVPHVQIFRF